jgi:hypothetical protein
MTETPTAWVTELQELLTRAAKLSTKHGVSSDDFMSAAWNAVLDANPGLREELIDKELRQQLKRLRRQGLMPQA